MKQGEGQVWTLALHESGGSISGQGTAVFSTLVSVDEYQLTVNGTRSGASVNLDCVGEPGPAYFAYDGTIVSEDSIAGAVLIRIVGTRTDTLNLARR